MVQKFLKDFLNKVDLHIYEFFVMTSIRVDIHQITLILPKNLLPFALIFIY